MEDTERLDFWKNKNVYSKLQEEFLKEFRVKLMKKIEPIVNQLVVHLRQLEKEYKGRGKDELDDMLVSGSINKPMYDIILPTLSNLDKDYRIELFGKNNNFEPTILS